MCYPGTREHEWISKAKPLTTSPVTGLKFILTLNPFMKISNNDRIHERNKH